MFFILLQDFDAELSQPHHVLQSFLWRYLMFHYVGKFHSKEAEAIAD